MSTMSKDLMPEPSSSSSQFYGRFLHDEFRPPAPVDLHHCTLLAHGTVYVEKMSSFTRYSYALEPTEDTNEDGLKPVVVLTADKDKKSKSPFIIRNAATNKVVGSVVLQFKTMKYISYAVFRGDLQVASIVYHVPTILDFLKLDPPRTVQMALPDFTEKNPIWLADVCKESIQKTGSLQAACIECPGLLSLKNAVPYKKPDGNYGLNFCGRGQQSSCRNTQLLDAKEKLICQMAKWDTNVYNVDFASPGCSFLAFAFALAQLDI